MKKTLGDGSSDSTRAPRVICKHVNDLDDGCHLGLAVAGEVIQRDDGDKAERPHVLHVLGEFSVPRRTAATSGDLA
jgi:hypothetical protein